MTRNKRVAVIQQQTKQTPKGPVCCRNCEHAKLIRYGSNPILALCPKKPAHNKYGWDVDVASSMKHCSMYDECQGEKEITKLFCVRHHPMACYMRLGAATELQHTGQKTA